jgi:hypothetical protein
VIPLDTSISRWLAMDMKVKRPLEQKTIAKAKSGKCLLCESKAGSRGLCNAHYLQFYKTLTALPKRERIEFEAEQIREGRILPSGHIRQIRKPNPFLQPEQE